MKRENGKGLLVGLAVGAMTLTSYGQGQFLFSTHDTSFGNNISFVDTTQAVMPPNTYVQVFAAPVGSQQWIGLLPLLPINTAGAEAGYTNPQVFSVPGIANGPVSVSYWAFEGSSWDSSLVSSVRVYYRGGGQPGANQLTVNLSPAGEAPAELSLGNGAVFLFAVPEPSICTLSMIGAIGWLGRAVIRKRNGRLARHCSSAKKR
jgi:hypothetical protein